MSVSEEVLSFESDEHGFIREDYLEDELKSRLVKASTSLTSTTIDINQQLLYVKDIVNVPSVDSEPFINSINKGKEKLSETLSNMYDMDAKATKKLDKPQQDIEQMKTYLAKLKNAIDKNNITVDSYSSEKLTKQNFYKDFKLQADGRQALTSDKPIPLTEQEYKTLQDQIKDSKTVQDDRFEWDGEYFTLADGRIIRAYTDTNSDSAVSRMAFEFVSSIPENREDLKEYKQEEGKNMFAGAVKGTVDFFFGDAITLFGPDATLEERAWAGVFLFVKPAKVLDKVGSPFLVSGAKNIDDLAKSKGLRDAKPGKVDEVKDAANKGKIEATQSAIKKSEWLENLKNTENIKQGTKENGLNHIFDGEVLKNGKANGFHYEGMPDSKGKVVENIDPPNEYGVYRANIEVDGVPKKPKSTFFPKEWTPQQVIDATNQAFNNKEVFKNNRYRGQTDSGMVIEMIIKNDKIVSAYPLY